ncbi:hypothetical protein GRI35_07410 [Altererythrobacter aestiaquae]|uniref:DUF4864 domain-containing protein n=2 Tax=Pontixanthobacter aestiaquae TaxID=1509367 RepID=A0A844Z6R2_9SPHN|nr:hypothetical protein [Pontixanthobacter aestiaquae]
MMITKTKKMPGRFAPAFFVSAALVATLSPTQALAQAQPQQVVPTVQPPPSVRPTPSQLELSKMIWSTIAAVDHANRSGNYSVLRDISSQGFQIQNNAARLAEIFAGIRNSQIDLSNAFLVPPTYTRAPEVIQDGVFRVQGIFQLRPIAIGFDMYFQWEQGKWKLAGIDIQPAQMVERAPG